MRPGEDQSMKPRHVRRAPGPPGYILQNGTGLPISRYQLLALQGHRIGRATQSFRRTDVEPRWSAIRGRIRIARRGTWAHFGHRSPAPSAISVRAIRRKAPRRLIRFQLRLHCAAPRRGGPIPDWLSAIVQRVETFGGRGTDVRQILCTEYDVGVGIGWHRDKPHFDRVFGLSLGSDCKLRFRRQVSTKWERFTLEARASPRFAPQEGHAYDRAWSVSPVQTSALA